MPGAEVAQDLLHHPGVVNDGKDPHRVLADGAAQGVNMPNAEDQVAPFLGRELERWWWRNARTMRNQLRRQAPVADASHLVAVPAVVADHLCPLVRDVLGDGGQEVGGGEDLEVAVDLGIEATAVDDVTPLYV